ncbi:nucleoside 2-deoxyribosyltransferase domain-containing protein [Streptomyces sp. ODS05-4]|uniref:nucleoside 2-deoxyribosyltransferase domain-containing protein n=1 Tax=Streptomyces sp. ODS05-4 TaxID=2944939 RepID=UPI00210B720A|nr:nucleoside 2-deoxyribosyltransferase domain-containing protein [Streptomyces sp. ODS05-4]
MVREPMRAGPQIFLAGPTPDRSAPVPSWRPTALGLITAQWTGPEPLTVLSPESRDGVRAERYEHQVDWEIEARAVADAILFWILRDVKSLPGFTANVEFGLDVASGKAVLGAPADCPNPERNRYTVYVADRYSGPVCQTLADTVTEALASSPSGLTYRCGPVRPGRAAARRRRPGGRWPGHHEWAWPAQRPPGGWVS